jgi:CBS domain-containing protein
MTFDPVGAARADARMYEKRGDQPMTSVREVMTTQVLSVRRTTPLKEVAQLLVDHKISGLPVVDIDGTVLGVVSEADFLIKEIGKDAVRHRPLARVLGESRETRTRFDKIEARRAADAMTAPPITIEPSRPIGEAARLMTERKVNRLPVVDDGRLVGIVTRADLVRAYVRSDGELEETIREDVIHRLLWLDPASFKVRVKDGVASISGHVERRSTAGMIGQATAAVPGIIDVEASITWSLDESKFQPEPVELTSRLGPR